MSTYRVGETLALIDEAVEDCHQSHAADIAGLRTFCQSAVGEVVKICAKVAELGFPHPDIDKEMLGEPLTKCLAYMRARSTRNVTLFIFSIGTRTSGDCPSVSIADLKCEIRTTICNIIEPVLLACQRSMPTDGSPLQERSYDAATVEVLYAIQDVDMAICLGYAVTNEYVRRIDKIIMSLRVSVDPDKRLFDKLDKIERITGAIRIAQEDGLCPRAFFLVPSARKVGWFKSKLRKIGWSKSLRNVNVFHKNMDLYFLCNMAFDDLRSAASETKQEEKTESRLVGSQEMSLPLEVQIPRGFVTKWRPVIELTLKLVNLFVHAGASAVWVEPFLPDLTLSEHHKLLGVLKSDFEAVLKIERSSSIAPEDGGTPCQSTEEVEGMSLYGSARQIMQKYLNEVHLENWNTRVLKNLRLATNKQLEVAYICKHNNKHHDAWTAKS